MPAEVIELARHARTRRILFLFLRRHGVDFFLQRPAQDPYPRLDPRKVDLMVRLGEDATRAGGVRHARAQADSARAMVRRILIRRLAFKMVENGY